MTTRVDLDVIVYSENLTLDVAGRVISTQLRQKMREAVYAVLSAEFGREEIDFDVRGCRVQTTFLA